MKYLNTFEYVHKKYFFLNFLVIVIVSFALMCCDDNESSFIQQQNVNNVEQEEIEKSSPNGDFWDFLKRTYEYEIINENGDSIRVKTYDKITQSGAEFIEENKFRFTYLYISYSFGHPVSTFFDMNCDKFYEDLKWVGLLNGEIKSSEYWSWSRCKFTMYAPLDRKMYLRYID